MTNKHLTEQNAEQNRQALAFGFGLVFFVAVLISLMSAAWWLSQQMFGQERSPVNSIIISGEMPYTQRNDVLASMTNIDLGNFFEVDVNDIQAQVSALPWVYSVSVRKQWPDEVKIYVVDQTPIALWNGDFLLNQFGKAFQADTRRLNQALPQFFGPEGSELLALENYRNLNDLLEFSHLAIDELVLSERFSWQLVLNDGVMLNLGREERVERIQLFMDVYPLIKSYLKQNTDQKTKQKNLSKKNSKKQHKLAVDYIDLRYDTGLAVGWKSVEKLTPKKSPELS
ncbi:MAG: cell division protein FtsQ/DivIB [Colwellia sp.]|nr:cell division protein FtsQ/DivIB [Colwellia sp.]